MSEYLDTVHVVCFNLLTLCQTSSSKSVPEISMSMDQDEFIYLQVASDMQSILYTVHLKNKIKGKYVKLKLNILIGSTVIHTLFPDSHTTKQS